MHKPTERLWRAAKCVLRYLKGTETLGPTYRKGGVKLFLQPLSDLDWGQERQSRKSISGNLVMFSRSCVTWRSKQQTVVAQSLMEAEFVSM